MAEIDEEGEEFGNKTGLLQSYPTLPKSIGLENSRSHCFICQPALVFRRSMRELLEEFDQQWRTAFDFVYWLRAFDAFPHRIGYIPHLQDRTGQDRTGQDRTGQDRTRLHSDTITARQRAHVALEATHLLARHFSAANSKHLNNYALELQLGIADRPEGVDLTTHLQKFFESARIYLTSAEMAQL